LANHQPPSIHVVLDTNCLFTEAADKLIATDLSAFILNDSQQLGLKITWYLPSIVKAERKYQMAERGKKLLPALVKVESLLGHALGINAEVLEGRVDDAIKRQIDRHHLAELELAAAKVNWDTVIHSAAQRLPPFEAGEKEKGFRDALVLETFDQLAASLPKSSASARVILLSSDKLLQVATRERFKDRSNVLIADGLDEVRTILNAVASHLTQEAIGSILPKASKLFFTGMDNHESLYYRAQVQKEINRQFKDQYENPPEADSSVEVKKVLIGPPTFLAKDRQRLSLSSKITFSLESTKAITRSVPRIGASTGLLGAIGNPPKPPSTGLLSLAMLGSSSHEIVEEVKRTGEAIFEVFWIVTLNRRGGLANPHLDKIDLRSVSWDSQPLG